MEQRFLYWLKSVFVYSAVPNHNLLLVKFRELIPFIDIEFKDEKVFSYYIFHFQKPIKVEVNFEPRKNDLLIIGMKLL
jgi:hypothetical protein